MNFSLSRTLEILRNTPMTIQSLLNGLGAEWTDANEGESTWTTKEVVAHLIVCEQTNWLPRTKIILSKDQNKILTRISMQDHFELAQHNTLQDLMNQFIRLRQEGIAEIDSFKLTDADLQETALHPELGEVQLSQMLATWVTHDLSHLAQIVRIMAKQNQENVGPFMKFLSILKNSK